MNELTMHDSCSHACVLIQTQFMGQSHYLNRGHPYTEKSRLWLLHGWNNHLVLQGLWTHCNKKLPDTSLLQGAHWKFVFETKQACYKVVRRLIAMPPAKGLGQE